MLISVLNKYTKESLTTSKKKLETKPTSLKTIKPKDGEITLKKNWSAKIENFIKYKNEE